MVHNENVIRGGLGMSRVAVSGFFVSSTYVIVKSGFLLQVLSLIGEIIFKKTQKEGQQPFY